MNPKLAHLLIAMGLAGGLDFEPSRPGICSAEPDPGGGGGGNDAKFTQADVDKIVGERLARAKKDGEKAVSDAVAAAIAKANEESAAKLAELEAKIADAGKSEAERAKSERERAEKAAQTRAAKLEQERDAEKAARAAAEKAAADEKLGRRTDRLATQLTAALLKEKAVGSTVETAVKLFFVDAKVEFDEDGKPTIEGFGGTYTDVAEAAKAFLKAQPIFASHPGGGNGTRHTAGGNGSLGLPADASAGELISAGLRDRARRMGQEPDVPGA